MGSGVLAQVTTASGAVGVALQPVHNVFQVSAVAAALTPHKHSLHHMVAHCTYAGTLVTPREGGADCGSDLTSPDHNTHGRKHTRSDKSVWTGISLNQQNMERLT